MIKALIFDLDNCLAAANEAGESLYAPVFAAIRQAGHQHLSEETLQTAFHDCWLHALDWVALKHGFTDAMLQAGWQALGQIEVAQTMHGYGDLHLLPELPSDRFLVTSGFRRLQQSKINALNIARWFTAVYIDAIEEPARAGKRGIFQEILRLYNLRPAETWVIGDNPASELAVGLELGLTTIQILRPGVEASDKATFKVRDLAELKTLLTGTRKSGL